MSSYVQSSLHLGGTNVLPPLDPALPDVLDPRDGRVTVRAALESWLAFQHRVGLDPRRARGLLCEGGGIEGALRRAPHSRGGSLAIGGAAERLLACGAAALPILSPAYPERLKRLPDAPPLLLVRGDVGALTAPTVAIVGSRAATVYGLAAAREFAFELARAGLTIVSPRRGVSRGDAGSAARAARQRRPRRARGGAGPRRDRRPGEPRGPRTGRFRRRRRDLVRRRAARSVPADSWS